MGIRPIRFGFRFPSVAAAVAEQNAGEDDEPDPVVVKKLTNAVAVHNSTLPFRDSEWTERHLQRVCRHRRFALLLS